MRKQEVTLNLGTWSAIKTWLVITLIKTGLSLVMVYAVFKCVVFTGAL